MRERERTRIFTAGDRGFTLAVSPHAIGKRVRSSRANESGSAWIDETSDRNVSLLGQRDVEKRM